MRVAAAEIANRIEPSGGKSHTPDSILQVPKANSRILAHLSKISLSRVGSTKRNHFDGFSDSVAHRPFVFVGGWFRLFVVFCFVIRLFSFSFLGDPAKND